MTLKRKLAVTTIAASVAMSAFAGIPLSNKGLAEKLGVSGVAYATSLSDLFAKADKIYTELAKDTADVDAVVALQTKIREAIDADSSILSTLVDGISNGEGDLEAGLEGLLSDLLTNIIPSNAEETFGDYAEEYEGLLTKIRDVHEIPGLTVEDLASVILQLQLKFADILVDLQFSNILTVKEDLKNAAREAIESNDNVEELVNKSGITSEDLADVYVAIVNEVDAPTLVAAYDAINRAYKAAFPKPPVVVIPTVPTVPTNPIDIPAEVKELENKLGELKDKLDNASDEEKAELIAEAVKEAQAVVDKLSNIEATVKVEDGKATLELDEKKALSAIAGIAAAAAALKDATGEEIKTQTITIDLGKVDQDEVAVGLSTALVEEAIKANLGAVEFAIEDLKIAIPIGGQFNQAVDLTVNRSEATSEVTGGLPAASDVYDFSLNIGGQPVSRFDKPVQLSIPVNGSDDVDTDLLTLAKIIEGKLEYYGGKYSNGSVRELRDTFSSYVVVENKVSFDDTAAVEAWAGRAIEVIAAKGAINGKAEGVFDPSANVTRAEFAKMLVHALDLDNSSAKEGFADVKAGDWFAPYVASAYEKGIINGRSATKFDPTAKITRAEMATMVTRALKYIYGTANVENLNEALAAFSDAGQISGALAEGVAFAANYGIVVGNEGKFAPNNNASRAQAAVIIYRAYKFED